MMNTRKVRDNHIIVLGTEVWKTVVFKTNIKLLKPELATSTSCYTEKASNGPSLASCLNIPHQV
jgi:hypothetical protein